MANNNFQKRSARKRKLWQAHVRAWKKSGLSQNEYCRRNKLSCSQFCYWKKNLGQPQAKPSVSFVPVPAHAPELPSSSASDDSGLTIFLDNGIQIGLNNGFISATLSKVLAVLGGQP